VSRILIQWYISPEEHVVWKIVNTTNVPAGWTTLHKLTAFYVFKITGLTFIQRHISPKLCIVKKDSKYRKYSSSKGSPRKITDFFFFFLVFWELGIGLSKKRIQQCISPKWLVIENSEYEKASSWKGNFGKIINSFSVLKRVQRCSENFCSGALFPKHWIAKWNRKTNPGETTPGMLLIFVCFEDKAWGIRETYVVAHDKKC
jgi:hypothetical protein